MGRIDSVERAMVDGFTMGLGVGFFGVYLLVSGELLLRV